MTSLPLFTSNRERRLWLWTLAAVPAVYSTLGPARLVTDPLRERNLLRMQIPDSGGAKYRKTRRLADVRMDREDTR